MAEKKVFIDNQNMATFVCPRCQKVKTSDVSEYKNINKAVRVQCRCVCGCIYTVVLERRKFYRKTENLSGLCVLGPKKIRVPMIVKNLSLTGLRFEIKSDREINVGDKILVEFQLNDINKTLIKKEVIIKSIGGMSIGAEFCTPDIIDSPTQALEFYLFN